MPILDHFIAGFAARFPERPLPVRASDATAVIAGSNPRVGDEVQGSYDELIVSVGDITHGHFECYERSLSLEQRHQAAAGDVLDFLADVFADRIEFYRTARGGGWRPAGTGPEPSWTWTAARDG